MDLGTPPDSGGETFNFPFKYSINKTAKISPPGSGGAAFHEERMEIRGVGS